VNQIAKAADEISGLIADIEKVAGEAIDAINCIGEVSPPRRRTKSQRLSGQVTSFWVRSAPRNFKAPSEAAGHSSADFAIPTPSLAHASIACVWIQGAAKNLRPPACRGRGW
jgi:hypothetical protein